MYRKYGVFDTDIESSRQMADDSDRLNFFMSRLNESMIKAGYISNPEESVRVFLKRLRDLFRADRTYVCELNPFGVYDNTFESRAPGISTDQEALRQIVNMAVSELGENLSHGRGFMIADMDEFRSANPRLYGMISGNGLKRTVICPLMNESRLLGVIGIDNPSKENMDVCTALFQMSADYVSMKLCRGAGTVKNDSSDRRDQITGLYSSNVFQNSLTAFAEKLAEVEVEGKWDIVCFNIGMTLREGDREYYYQALDKHFPGLSKQYMMKYGNAYDVASDNSSRLMRRFHEICEKYGIIHDPDECFAYTSEFPERYEQMSFFD